MVSGDYQGRGKMPPQTIAHYNGTLQWHHVHSPKVGRHPPQLQWHPAMAPCNGTTSTPPKLVVNPPELQRHPAVAPRPLPQSWPSPSPSLLAHYNGTLQWHHVSWSSPSPTIAHYNGTTSTAPCNGTLVPRPSRQSGSSPSPPIGSKNPYS